jgi:hypothetical protein
MANDELKMSAANFGFDATWVAEILKKYGGDALALAIEAARNGFSVAFIVEVLQKFGPAILEFILSLFTQHQASLRMRGMVGNGDVVTGDVIEGIDASFLDVIIQKYLPVIIEKYLPTIFAQFGPMIMEFLKNNMQSIFEKFGPEIIQMILQLFLNNLKAAKQ